MRREISLEIKLLCKLDMPGLLLGTCTDGMVEAFRNGLSTVAPPAAARGESGVTVGFAAGLVTVGSGFSRDGISTCAVRMDLMHSVSDAFTGAPM